MQTNTVFNCTKVVKGSLDKGLFREVTKILGYHIARKSRGKQLLFDLVDYLPSEIVSVNKVVPT